MSNKYSYHDSKLIQEMKVILDNLVKDVAEICENFALNVEKKFNRS